MTYSGLLLMTCACLLFGSGYRLYPELLTNWNFDCAKAPGFDDRKEARIALILTSLRSIEPRELSRCPNSNFLTARGIDDATWERGRGWALSNALIALPYYKDTNPVLANNARHVIQEVIEEDRMKMMQLPFRLYTPNG